jgi:hypothetical protein
MSLLFLHFVFLDLQDYNSHNVSFVRGQYRMVTIILLCIKFIVEPPHTQQLFLCYV